MNIITMKDEFVLDSHSCLQNSSTEQRSGGPLEPSEAKMLVSVLVTSHGWEGPTKRQGRPRGRSAPRVMRRGHYHQGVFSDPGAEEKEENSLEVTARNQVMKMDDPIQREWACVTLCVPL